MATYDIISKASGGSWKSGFNMVYNRLDISAINRGAGLAVDDVVRLIKIPDYGVLYESWYKMAVHSTAVSTADIGTTYSGAGQEIAAGITLNTGLGEWTQGTIQTDGAAEEIMDAESYVTLECLTLPVADGVFEVAVVLVMFPGDLVPMSQTVLTS